jgi:predicted AAA+ superfamily ATPase
MFMNIVVQRKGELERIKKLGPWVFVFGRRKTGKTYFVKNFLEWDEYFFVRRDNKLLDKDENELSLEAFLEVFKREIGRKVIVIDEFHRLPESFFDFLHSIGIKGRLIAISSTLSYSRKILSKGSPLLGLFSEFKFNLVDERDIINSLKDFLSGKELVEAAVYLREPWLIPKFEENRNLRDFLTTFLLEQRGSIKALIGEIFSEEDRKLSLVYEGILKAIADGRTTSTEISSFLFSRKLIPKDNPGLIQSYLEVLRDIGLIEKVEVFGSRKFKYFHISPLLDLHYYLEEKYAYSEVDVPEKFVRKVIDEKVPFHVESFFASLLSKKLGLKKVIVEKPETDIALVEFNRIGAVGEVKWKKIKQVELEEIEEKLCKFKDAEKYVILQEKDGLESKKVKLLDYKDFT